MSRQDMDEFSAALRAKREKNICPSCERDRVEVMMELNELRACHRISAQCAGRS